MEVNPKKMVVLISIDGWGVSSNTQNNAIRKAQISGFKNLIFNYPSIIINPPNLENSKNYQSLGAGKNFTNINSFHDPSISKIISHSNLSQLKIASSYDFPLVSVFFNNFSERLAEEDWVIVDDKKNKVISFLNRSDLFKNLINSIRSEKYNFIFSSFSDIISEVLHGDFLSCVSAVENISENLEKISQAVLDVGGVLVVTATCGGAEDMYNVGTGLLNKKRTANPVPFLIIGEEYWGKNIGFKEAPNNDLSLLDVQGSYLDVAPTILKLLNLEISSDMEGKPLVRDI
ncbi:MAG: hypothetical protein WC928_01945 [Patescibacteria group bacterium]|jgi:2,3-bisphosphoglycerate-independent phosphoglycerate mutase